MAANDQTVVYSARFDATGIEQGAAKADAAFEKMEKTAVRAFVSIEQRAGRVAGKGNPWSDPNSSVQRDLARHAANAQKFVQVDEESLENRARLQARHEEEYQAALHQADIAEAALVRNKWESRIAVQRVMMKKELLEFGGNLEAQEQILRKHAAIIKGIELQMINSGERPNRVILTRLGTIAASANRVQGVLFGVSPLLGNLGGGLAQAAGGLMGVETALNAVTQGGKAMMISLGAAIAVLVAVGAAIALIRKQRMEMEALRENPEWLGSPEEFGRVEAAVKRYTEAQAALQARIDRNTKAGRPAVDMMAVYAREMTEATEASKQLEQITGRSGEELKKFIAQFGDGKAAVDAFYRTTQTRLVAVRNELSRARLEMMEEGIEREETLEGQRYQEALQNERTHLDAILLNEKLDKKKKAAAQREYDLTIEEMYRVHVQKLENIRTSARRKEFEADREAYDVAQEDFDRRTKERTAKEIEGAKQEREIEVSASNARLAEEKRLEEVRIRSDAERFVKRQNQEREDLEIRIQNAERMTDAFTRSYVLQQLAAEKVTQAERQRLETDQKIVEVQGDLLQSTLALAAIASTVFDNSRMSRVVGETIKWVNALNEARKVLLIIKSLEILSGGGTTAAASGGTPGILGLLFGFADGGVVTGRNRVVKMNENGEEGILNPRGLQAAGGREGLNRLNSGMPQAGGGLVVHMGGIHIAPGTDMGAVTAAVESGVVRAARQLEANRGAGYYDNGTYKS